MLKFEQYECIVVSKKKNEVNYPIIIPAIVAEINEAIDPPIRAFMPNLESCVRCPGASDPIPPICMPIEAKFAKPQSI